MTMVNGVYVRKTRTQYQLERRDRCVQRLKGIWDRYLRYHWSDEELIDTLARELYRSDDWRKMSGDCRCYVNGYVECLRDAKYTAESQKNNGN